MSTRDEDELWRSIVENYGDRAVLDEGPDLEPPSQHAPEGGTETPSRSPLMPGPEPAGPPAASEPREGFVPFTGPTAGPEDDVEAMSSSEAAEAAGVEEPRFVPPTPPLPEMDRLRWAAWIAVLGSPTAFVVSAIADVRLNGLFAAVLALLFMGGFGWLVAHMPRDPGDPWDDGARV